MNTNYAIDPLEFMGMSWEQIEPLFQDLLDRPLDSATVSSWLEDWTALGDRLLERYSRLNVGITRDTTDKDAEAAYMHFLEHIYQPSQAANQRLKEKLLASGLQPEGFEVPLRKMRTEASIFRHENLPLLTQERKLSSQYNKIIGAQSVTWNGEERTLVELRTEMESPDRELRQRVWRSIAGRQLADRQAINDLWGQFLELRMEIARNAGMRSYRDYAWKNMLRLDYSPQECLQFQEAIEKTAVPAASRVYQRSAQRLGVEALRPWDLDLDLYPLHWPPLPSYGSTVQLQETTERIFHRVSPILGGYFQTMRAENLLDLDNRKGKAPGAYCTSFPASRRPFIFMNAVGLANDVRTVLHEAGHAFHNFEVYALPYTQQRRPGLEFSEVASMSMELLTGPYLTKEEGGFYEPQEAAKARIIQLERMLVFWPYMAVVDAFQHWVYENIEAAQDPASCDACWLELWQRFIPGVDWSGLEEEAKTGWHRKLHIHTVPFYYVEYGLAQLGSVQVWASSLRDQAGAVAAYRRALAMGGTAALPELYAAAGARFAFNEETLGPAVKLLEDTIESLEASAQT
jgi:oligoendopeptidase F